MPDTESMQQGDGAQRRPLLVGVTGGIGSGKSTVVAELVKHGAVAFSADQVVHNIYESDADVRAALVGRWGQQVAPPNGPVDRVRIADIVFADPHELRWLEDLIHPLVAREWMRFVAHVAAQSSLPAMIVAEVPLLFEAGLEDRYDVTIAVVSPQATRIQRVGERATGGTQLTAKLKRQMSDPERSKRATHVLINDSTLQQLCEQVDKLVSDLSTG